jgi:REP element-mobilizing transposase RayT
MRWTRRDRMIGAVHKPRVEVPGGYYHVCTRGNNRQPIFLGDLDRTLFLIGLERAARRYGWRIYAYCLMTNHYHLLLQLGERGLSQGMCELNGGYAFGFNARHGRSNHVFGRRFWSDLIDDDSRLVTCSRYVVLNPVRAGLRSGPASWRWSSYRACAGLEHAPAFLATASLLAVFGSDPRKAQAAYRSYVEKGPVQRQPPWREGHTPALRERVLGARASFGRG